MKESIAASDAARAQITEKKKALEAAARGRTEALLKVIDPVFPSTHHGGCLSQCGALDLLVHPEDDLYPSSSHCHICMELQCIAP